MKTFSSLAGAVASIAAAAISTQASAAIVVGNVTSSTPVGGAFVKLATPGTLTAVGDRTSQLNSLNQLHLYGFDEKSVTLANPLSVALTKTTSTLLGAGAKVDSHILFFDPRRTGEMEGTIQFSGNILGILFSTASQTATDALFGTAGSYSSVTARGLENIDMFSFTPGSNILNVDFRASNPGDTIRIITAAVPEPATWAMMIFGFGMIGYAMRSQRQRAKVSFV